MIKPSKKWLAYFATLGLCLITTGAIKSQADDIYTDSNVSIYTAVDRYMETSDGKSSAVNMSLFESTFGSTLQEKAVPTSISAYMDEDLIPGEEDTTEQTTEEETTTEATTEETTTETPTTESVPAEEDVPYVAPTDCKYPEYADKAVIVTNSTVNVRKQATTSSSVVGWAAPGQVVTVKSKSANWSKVSFNGTEGYVKNEFLAYADAVADYVNTNTNNNTSTETTEEAQGETIAVINSGSLRLRADANTSSACLAYLPAGGSYLVISEGDTWTNIQVTDSLKGYVHNDYITITKGQPNNKSAILVDQEPEEDTSGDSSSDTTTEDTPTDIPTGGSGITSCTGQDIANYAVQYVGNPYVYGGTSLTQGADCSGFVMRVYADHGISLSRTAYWQSFDGIEISMSQLVPGDLIIFDYGTGTIQHVGIYIGNNQYVHAANSSLGIVISNLNASSVYTCRRIIY